MRRILLAVAALVIPASAVTLGLGSGAWANGGTSCSELIGGSDGPTYLSGCTDRANTGGSGTSPSGVFEGGGTITWATGGTTTVKIKFKAVKKDHQTCPAGNSKYSIKGRVTGGTGAGTSVTGRVKGKVCVVNTGGDAGYTMLEPGTVLKL